MTVSLKNYKHYDNFRVGSIFVKPEWDLQRNVWYYLVLKIEQTTARDALIKSDWPDFGDKYYNYHSILAKNIKDNALKKFVLIVDKNSNKYNNLNGPYFYNEY